MVFIKTGNKQGAKHRENRSSPPQSPMLDDGHPVKRLPPTVEKSDTYKTVTNKVAGLADEMMYLRPMGRADGPKEPNPQRVKPLAGVVCGEGGRGLERDHQNAQRRRHPVQHPLQHRLQPKSGGTHTPYYRGGHFRGRVAPALPGVQICAPAT